jgi:hypothetical protein
MQQFRQSQHPRHEGLPVAKVVEVAVHLDEDLLGRVPRFLVVAHVVQGETVDSRLKTAHQRLPGDGVPLAAAQEEVIEIHHWWIKTERREKGSVFRFHSSCTLRSVKEA